MARLPITIDSSAQQSVLPTAELQVTGVTPDAFGGGIGSGLQKLGAAGEDAASAYGQAQILKAKDQERLANFDRQTQFVNFGSDQSTKLEEAQRNLSGTGQGFTADAAAQFDTDSKTFLDAIPAHARPEWEAKMATLRSGFTRQALAAEFAQRDTYYKQTTDQTLNTLANGAMSSPDKLADWQAQGEQIINASGLTPDDKAAALISWKSKVQLAAAQGMIQQNPDAALTALGGTNPPTKIDVKQGGDTLQRMYAITALTESGGHETNPDGSTVTSPKGAQGSMQVMPTTQILPGFGVHPLPANATPAQRAQQGRDYLQAMVTRYGGDPAKGWAAYNAGPGRVDSAMAKAAQNGNPDNWLAYTPAETRNYVKKNLAQLGPVGQQTASAAPAGTASDASVAPSVDPRFADLPPDTRNSLIEASERQIDKREAVAAAAQQQQHSAWLNQFYQDLHDGKAGAADIESARKSGVLTDYDEITKSEDILKQTNKVDANLAYYNQVVNMPGYKFNPYDDKDKQAVDAAVKQAQTQGVDPAVAALAIWQKTRILGEAGAVAIRGNLVSTDPRAVQTAANVAGNMVRTNPNAFAGVSGGEDIEKAGFKFNHYTFDLGMSPDAAAQRIAQENAPAYKSKIAIGDPELDAVRADIRKNGSSAAKVFGGGLFSSAPDFASPRQQTAANDDYAEMVIDNMRGGNDRQTAEAMAAAQMKKVWGIDQFGKVRKYPPELSYPSVGGGGYGYLYQQAAHDVMQSTGAKNVLPNDVRMVPIPGVTDADFRNGAPARYHIVFGHEVNGQHVYDVAPGQWRADVHAAQLQTQPPSNAPTDAQAAADVGATRAAAARYGARAAAMAANARGEDPHKAAAEYLRKSGLDPALATPHYVGEM